MKKQLFFLVYNLLLPIVFIVSFPSWVFKMRSRGGFGTGLMQRLGRYKDPEDSDLYGCVYVHAVSVGEVLIGLKLIRAWLEEYPHQKFVIVPTTATGHAVAKEQAPTGVRVVYSPVDFPWVVKKVLNRYKPRQVVLIESELWPNLLRHCQYRGIPVAIANARLSARSERRYKKLKWLLQPVISMVSMVLAQEEEDVKRWTGIGFSESVVKRSGSIKFDQFGSEQPTKRMDFQKIIDRYSMGRKVVLLVSTFPEEEKAIAEALLPIMERVFLVVVPRHAERRDEVELDLKKLGYRPVLRSILNDVGGVECCLIVDSTGELRDWTAHVDIAIIGKSWIAKGGQNPTEAIAASVPVIVGSRMDNFQPLIGKLVSSGGIIQLEQISELKSEVDKLLIGESNKEQMCKSARSMIEIHIESTKKSIEFLNSLACTM